MSDDRKKAWDITTGARWLEASVEEFRAMLEDWRLSRDHLGRRLARVRERSARTGSVRLYLGAIRAVNARMAPRPALATDEIFDRDTETTRLGWGES